MSINPRITFKAGICEVGDKQDSTGGPRHIKPQPTPGYIYLYTEYTEEALLHFCWRPRSASFSEPTLDLIMFPGDGTFEPYQHHGGLYKKVDPEYQPNAPSNGRLYVLSFSSSSDRHLFWLQSKSQHPSGDSSWHSPRDLKLGEIVNKILASEDVNVQQELQSVPQDQNGPGGDDDTAMEDADGGSASQDHHQAASGGAGTGATGGDFREEGEEAREGGADGGRAAATANPDTQAAVSNFLKSLKGTEAVEVQQHIAERNLFTTLPDLLQPSTTLPAIEKAEDEYLDELLKHLPPAILMADNGASSLDPDPETTEALIMSLDKDQKVRILEKVLRSPQFTQSLASLNMALRDGGLPTLSEALHIHVENGGYVQGGTMPLGGGDAVEAFLQGIKRLVEAEELGKGKNESKEKHMDTE